MAQTFNCPNCGAPLDYKGSDPIIRCPYCSGSVIVPDNLRAKPSFSKTPSNFTLSGAGDLSSLLDQARQLKDVKDLAESGDLENAEIRYMEITGADADSARVAVQRLAAGQPITLAGGMTADAVRARVQAVSMPQINISTEAVQTAGKIGWWMGCFIVFLVLTILASVLIPVGLMLAGTFGELNNAGITLEDLPIENPLPGFASQELAFGGEGNGPGLFDDGRFVVVHPSGSPIYAAEFGTGRIQSFDATGAFITQWIIPEGVSDPYISDLDVDRQGNVYVVVFGEIQKFSPTGELLQIIPRPDSLMYFDSLALLPDGRMVAISRGEDLVFLSASGEVTNHLEKVVSSVSGDSELSGQVAVDGLGNIYILGSFNNAVFIYDADGRYQNRFGSDGDQPGEFRGTGGLAVDGRGYIYVSDTDGVNVFDKNGRYIDVFRVSYYAHSIAVDDKGYVYVMTNQQMVEIYSINFPE